MITAAMTEPARRMESPSRRRGNLMMKFLVWIVCIAVVIVAHDKLVGWSEKR